MEDGLLDSFLLLFFLYHFVFPKVFFFILPDRLSSDVLKTLLPSLLALQRSLPSSYSIDGDLPGLLQVITTDQDLLAELIYTLLHHSATVPGVRRHG